MSIIALAFWIVFWMTVGPLIFIFGLLAIAAITAGISSLFIKGPR
jgi:hypothetical protein